MLSHGAGADFLLRDPVPGSVHRGEPDASCQHRALASWGRHKSQLQGNVLSASPAASGG